MINLLINLLIILLIILLINLLIILMSMLMILLMAMLILVLVILLLHSELSNISILTDILTRHHSFTPSASPLTARHLQTAPAPTPSPGLTRLCR